MSTITQVYDTVLGTIAGLLSSHVRLPNPYDIPSNPETFLRKGFGFAVGPGGNNTERFVCSIRTTLHSFVVTITRRAEFLENDAATKATTEKELLEDAQLIIDSAHTNHLGLTGAKATFTNYDGIGQVFDDKDNYLSIALTITVEHFVRT